jgi:hypothetical protein
MGAVAAAANDTADAAAAADRAAAPTLFLNRIALAVDMMQRGDVKDR